MNDELRQQVESAVLGSSTFIPDPDWHFVFIENPEILSGLLELIPGMETTEKQECLLSFSAFNDIASRADSASALYRACTILNAACTASFSELLAMYFNIPEGKPIAAAFGVPEGYVCTGALLINQKSRTNEETPAIRWDVFSYIR